MINLEQKDMCEAELRQAIRILQSVLINLRKSNELEMEIYYFLSGLNALPESYTLYWNTTLAR